MGCLSSKEQEFNSVATAGAEIAGPPAPEKLTQSGQTQQQVPQQVQQPVENGLTSSSSVRASANASTNDKSTEPGVGTGQKTVSSSMSAAEGGGSVASTSTKSHPLPSMEHNTLGNSSTQGEGQTNSTSATLGVDSARMHKSPGGTLGVRWEEKKTNFRTCAPEELLSDVSNLSYLGSGGYSSVFKAHWHSATVALKLVASQGQEFEKSAGFYEALLGKELSHPNLVRCFETRCAKLTQEFVTEVVNSRTPIRFDTAADADDMEDANPTGAHPLEAQETFVSGDGFGSPAINRAPNNMAITWRDLMFCVGARPNDYLTVVILEFCDWGCLNKAITKGVFRPGLGTQSEGRLRYRALLRTVREIVQGLDHLHRLDVVHGDVKPANVLLKGSRSDRRGFTVQLIDYGLSRFVHGSGAMSASAKGTLNYMAPEVFGGHISKATDMYSVGIILWEMLTGIPPYMGIQQGQVVMGVQSGALRPTWPDDLDIGRTKEPLQELYLACVAQDPKARPSAKEAVIMLTKIENDLRAELKAEFTAQQQLIAHQQHLSGGSAGQGSQESGY